MQHFRRSTSSWLISQALCFCLLLQGSGIAQALPLPSKKIFVSQAELEAALGGSPSRESSEPSSAKNAALRRFGLLGLAIYERLARHGRSHATSAPGAAGCASRER